MGDVYARLFCTVVASASSDPDGGLFRTRDPDFIQAGLVESNEDFLYVLDNRYWDRHMFDGTLHTRGWAFQECLLSPTVLYFSRHQVMWECRIDHKCEAFRRGIPCQWSHRSFMNLDPVFGNLEEAEQPADPSSWMSAWVDLIEEYPKCSLTVPATDLWPWQ